MILDDIPIALAVDPGRRDPPVGVAEGVLLSDVVEDRLDDVIVVRGEELGVQPPRRALLLQRLLQSTIID